MTSLRLALTASLCFASFVLGLNVGQRQTKVYFDQSIRNFKDLHASFESLAVSYDSMVDSAVMGLETTNALGREFNILWKHCYGSAGPYEPTPVPKVTYLRRPTTAALPDTSTAPELRTKP